MVEAGSRSRKVAVVRASTWLKRGPSQGSGDSSCNHGVEAGSWSTEVARGAGAGIRWRF
jgi:hypothetical protein